MCRLLFCLLSLLIAFGFSSVIVFNFCWKSEDKINTNKTVKITAAEQIEKKVEPNFLLSNVSSFTQANQVATKDKPKLSCSDEELLPVWNELEKDRQFKEREKDFYLSADCSEMLEVQRIDLNDDGQNEITLWGNNGNLCGGTGNCDVWVYEKRNKKFKQILQTNAFHELEDKWFEVKKAKTNGYSNLLLKEHDSASETIERHYEFDGSRYKEKKCLYVSYISPEKEPSIMTCKEAWEK